MNVYVLPTSMTDAEFNSLIELGVGMDNKTRVGFGNIWYIVTFPKDWTIPRDDSFIPQRHLNSGVDAKGIVFSETKYDLFNKDGEKQFSLILYYKNSVPYEGKVILLEEED